MKRILIAIIMLASINQTFDAQNVDASKTRKETIQVDVSKGQIDVLSGVVYSQVTTPRSNRPLRMTVFVPRTNELKGLIVYFPGGGFTSADYEKYVEMRMALANAGFVVAAAEYRTVPDKFPALIEDAKAAVRYLKAHWEQYGIDTTSVGVIGDSAGGYVSQMLGTTNGETQFDKGDYLNVSSDVQAVATLYGISNLLNIGEGYSDKVQKVHQSPAVTEALLLNGVAFANFEGASILTDSAKALAASPMGHIKDGLPPFLIMHGTNDMLVSPIQSEQLYNALEQSGNTADYIVVQDAGHGDLVWYQKSIIDLVVNWFKEHLGDNNGKNSDYSSVSNL